jgi:hypothetical protein
MKKTYWFKPHGHWNVVRDYVYEYLTKFFGEDMLRITDGERPT